MKKLIAIALCLVFVLSLSACGGGGDALKGTWVQENSDYGTVTWIFDGKGKCSLETDFLSKTSGTYTIVNDNTVNIKIDVWDSEKVYEYTVSGDSLALTATDGLAPDYNLTKK